MAEKIPQQLIDEAMKWSVIDYFNRFEPTVIHQVGNGYRRRDHPSCCISADGWLYDWKSRGLSGKGALSYLRKCEGIGFRDAVMLLTGENIELFREQHTEPEIHQVTIPFALPERNNTNRNVIDYLYNRGVSKEVIQHCINRGALYQSKEYVGAVLIGYDEQHSPMYILRENYQFMQKAKEPPKDIVGYSIREGLVLSPATLSTMRTVSNAVFVGFDNEHKPAYAAKRGLYNKQVVENGKVKNNSFRQEVSGSSKSYSFYMRDVTGKSNSIHLFEAAIDAMSYATLIQLYSSDFSNKNLLSLGGAQSGKDNKFDPEKVTLPLALEQIFSNEQSNISKVYIHFDNDEAGIKHAKSLSEKLSRRGIENEVKLPPNGKDFNDFLKNTLQKLEANKNLNARELLQQR